MKTFHLLLVAACILALYSCSKNELDKINANGQIQITFVETEVEGSLKLNKTDALTPKIIVITVRNAAGEIVLNAKKLRLTKLGDNYFTESVELKVGEYAVEEFLVTNSFDSAFYLTPKKETKFEKLVTTPLPFTFSVFDNEITPLEIDVLWAYLGTAKDFGYGAFSFNMLTTWDIQSDTENETISSFVISGKVDSSTLIYAKSELNIELPKVEVGCQQYMSKDSIDINGDSEYDLLFSYNEFNNVNCECGEGDCIGGLLLERQIKILNSNFKLLTDSNNWIEALSYGDTIDSRKFCSQEQELFLFRADDPSGDGQGYWKWAGFEEDRYVGVSLVVETDTLYGWILMNTKNTIEIKEYYFSK